MTRKGLLSAWIVDDAGFVSKSIDLLLSPLATNLQPGDIAAFDQLRCVAIKNQPQQRVRETSDMKDGRSRLC
jgi:hypothetical protein